jgi:chaperonin cofactor prefoldin
MALTNGIKDAFYVAVGFGVIGFQKAQVRRVELERQLKDQARGFETQTETLRKQVEEQVDGLRTQFAAIAKLVDARVEPVLDQVEERVEELEARLPEQVQELVKRSRTAAHEVRTELRERLAGAGAAA